MWEDPIVAEVRAIREELAAKFDFDVKAIFADLRQRQGSSGGRLIRQKKQPEPAPQVVPEDSSDTIASQTFPAV